MYKPSECVDICTSFLHQDLAADLDEVLESRRRGMLPDGLDDPWRYANELTEPGIREAIEEYECDEGDGPSRNNDPDPSGGAEVEILLDLLRFPQGKPENPKKIVEYLTPEESRTAKPSDPPPLEDEASRDQPPVRTSRRKSSEPVPLVRGPGGRGGGGPKPPSGKKRPQGQSRILQPQRKPVKVKTNPSRQRVPVEANSNPSKQRAGKSRFDSGQPPKRRQAASSINASPSSKPVTPANANRPSSFSRAAEKASTWMNAAGQHLKAGWNTLQAAEGGTTSIPLGPDASRLCSKMWGWVGLFFPFESLVFCSQHGLYTCKTLSRG